MWLLSDACSSIAIVCGCQTLVSHVFVRTLLLIEQDQGALMLFIRFGFDIVIIFGRHMNVSMLTFAIAFNVAISGSVNVIFMFLFGHWHAGARHWPPCFMFEHMSRCMMVQVLGERSCCICDFVRSNITIVGAYILAAMLVFFLRTLPLFAGTRRSPQCYCSNIVIVFDGTNS